MVRPRSSPPTSRRVPPGPRFARRRAVPRQVRVPLARPVQPVARPRHRRTIPRPDATSGRRQDRAFLQHVRPQILQHEDQPGSKGFRPPKSSPERVGGPFGAAKWWRGRGGARRSRSRSRSRSRHGPNERTLPPKRKLVCAGGRINRKELDIVQQHLISTARAAFCRHETKT